MKTHKLICTFLSLIAIAALSAQVSGPNFETIDNETTAVSCKQMSTRIATGILRNTLVRNLELTLDRDRSTLRIMDDTQVFTIPEKKVKKPARDWTYYVKDIQSINQWIEFDNQARKFILTVEFEGNGSEIKGECRGCKKRFRDSRAPDINWKGKRLAKITLVPIAYDNSIAFEVEKVDLVGPFDLNGPTEKFFPSLIAFFESKLKDGIEKQARTILNSAENKQAMADAMRNTVRFLGLTRVRTVEITGLNLYICD